MSGGWGGEGMVVGEVRRGGGSWRGENEWLTGEGR